MLAAALFCCALAIFGANANINDAITIAAIAQSNAFGDASCQNPAAYQKAAFVNQALANNGQIDAIAAAIAQEKIIGASNINDVIVAHLFSNKIAENSANVLNQVLAAKIGQQDYSAQIAQNIFANDVIDIVATNNPLSNKKSIISKVNDISAINQISQILNAQQDFSSIASIAEISGIQSIGQKNCHNNVNCLIKTQAITQAVAQNICSNNLVGNKIVEAKIACNAGAIVGKTAGQQYNGVCQIAAQKFQQHSQQCVSDSCIVKQAFEVCCKNEENIAKKIIAASIIN